MDGKRMTSELYLTPFGVTPFAVLALIAGLITSSGASIIRGTWYHARNLL